MNWRKIVQLTMVHVGVSITVVPVTGTLNRIMIADMGLPALWVGILVAFPYLLSPLQVIVGSWADAHPLGGRRRSPWIVAGGLMAAFGGYFTGHAVYLFAAQPMIGALAAVGAFLVWGLGVNIASVSYLSLVTELSADRPAWRSRAISMMWSAMILGTIGTSLAIAAMLDPFSEEALYTAFGAIWLIAAVLVLFGASRLEPRALATTLETVEIDRRANSPRVAFQILNANPSAKRYFVYLLIVLISIHAQDVLLEPFGAEAMDMAVSMTSRLKSFWGLGFFITLMGGFWLVRRFGKRWAANVGAGVTAVAFFTIILTGLAQNATLFVGAVVLLGLGGGLMTISNLSFMLDMTIPQAAGLYMGAWGAANFAGQAIGNIVSGGLRDLVLWATGNPLVGYLAVFSLEIVGLLVAVWLFRAIQVEDFERDARAALPQTLTLTAQAAD
ncbi:MAG: BCD family MFS transporter [Litorilinea sp.]